MNLLRALSVAMLLGCGAPPLLACGGGGSEENTACDKGGPTGDAQETVQVNGVERSFFAHVPTAAANRSVALVFAYHGDGGKGESLRKSLKLEEQTQDLAIVIYPDARGGSFDIDTQQGNPDVAFFDAVVERYRASHCITKVFATGFSRGGYFANHLACYRGDKLAGVASHGSGGPYAAPYANGDLQCPSAPTASLVVHGLDDKSVQVSEADKTIKQWTRTLGCSDKTSASAPEPCVEYNGCKRPLEVCKVPGLGHSVWDQGIAKTWSFFQSQL